jgi:hypothetical protein
MRRMPTTDTAPAKLRAYLAEKNLRPVDLARGAEISTGLASDLLGGRRRAGLEVSHRIEKFTEGKVAAVDWVEFTPRRRKTSQRRKAS